jgi:hypothetical protein
MSGPGRAAAPRISVTVTLDDAHLGRAQQMSATLEGMGLKVDKVLPEIGVITGSGEEGLLDRLRAVDGVAEARPERGVRLPPFSDRVPQ